MHFGHLELHFWPSAGPHVGRQYPAWRRHGKKPQLPLRISDFKDITSHLKPKAKIIMAIIKNFTLPTSAKELLIGPGSKFFIAFISGSDPVTKQAWCPDVRAAMPSITAAFGGDDTPELAIVEVGQKPE